MYNNPTLIFMKPCGHTPEHRRIAYNDSAVKRPVQAEVDRPGLFQSRHKITTRQRSSSTRYSWLHKSNTAIMLELAPIALVLGPSVVCIRSTLDPSKLLCTPATATLTPA